MSRRLLPLAICLPACVGAADVHVAMSGLDANPGNAAQPFRTIQRASTVLSPGDTCWIHAGVYRETLRPANSGTAGMPITYRSAGDGEVTISAADPLVGWSPYQGDIYQAAMTTDLGARRNQVFVDGWMMVEARWPDVPWNAATGFDLLGAPLALASLPVGSGTVTVVSATQPAGFWTGASMWGEIGARWQSQTATISGSSPGSLSIASGSKSSPWFPDDFSFQGSEGGIYLTGVLAALDAPGEWHREGGVLRLMTVDRSDPSSHLVEVRSGRLVADLSARNWIVLRGLSGFAGTATLTGSDCIVQDCTFRYVTHEPVATGYATRGGISLAGTRNLFERCLVDGSSGNGVCLGGHHNTVRTSIIRNVDYMGDYSCAVNFTLWSPNPADQRDNVLEYCTLTNAGRALINPSGQAQRIRFNDISHPCRLTQDGGGMYTFNIDSAGTEIAWNRVHDALPWSVCAMTAPVDGIYLDDGCKNFVVHHNVVWNCESGIRINHWGSPSPTTHTTMVASGDRVFNNTLLNCRSQGINAAGPQTQTDPSTGVVTALFVDTLVYNNLSDVDTFANDGTDIHNNLTASDPQCVDAAGHDYRLLAGSPAIDVGRLIPGITDGYQGAAPDAGAYEYAGVGWLAGADQHAGADTQDGSLRERVRLRFGRRSSEAGWDALADGNSDGVIDSLDLCWIIRAMTP